MTDIDLGPIDSISLLIDGATLDARLSSEIAIARAQLDPGKRYVRRYESRGNGIAIVYRVVEEAKEMPGLVVSRC